MWLGVAFWRVILPLCYCSEWLLSHEFRVIGGEYFDKETIIKELGGSVLQDELLLMVVISFQLY